MTQEKVLHSICRWSFHAGKGGFVPAAIRPAWAWDKLDAAGVVRLVKEKIAPRLPKHIGLGFELHYDTEVDESTAGSVADALLESGMHLAMITPGAHAHYGYGGIASLDPKEREEGQALGKRTVDLAYGPLKKAWHPKAEFAPTLVLWNGSYGYDLATIAIRDMYQHLKASIADLCKHEQKSGGKLYIGIEPKPNEGHPAMLLPTVASALLLWKKLETEFGINPKMKGLNMEIGHSEMIGLDHVYDVVEQLDHDAMSHIHLNSQGYNDGITLGGPGKFDIDHGVKITGMNIAIAGLLQQASYTRWRGHDMQVRPYDNEEQGLDRIIRSVISWDACEVAAKKLDTKALLGALAERRTARAEDLIRQAVVTAHQYFDEIYS